MTENNEAIEKTETAVKKKSKPFVYDLTVQELFYYLGIEHNGRHLSVLAKMKPYIAGEMVQLLQERETAFVNSSSDADALDIMAPGAPEANRDFVDKHRIEVKVEGQVANEAVIEKMDALHKIRPLIIRYGYLNVWVEEKKVDEDQEFNLEEEFGDTLEIEVRFVMVDPKDDFEEKEVVAIFILRMPTAKDRRTWDGCMKGQALKKGGQRVRYEYSKIEHLANSMIVGVKSGFSLKGKTLNDTNREGREGWESLIPYIFKFRLMDNLFKVATEKNA